MTFAPNDEQRELTNIVRRFLTDKTGPEAIRRQMETGDGFDAAVWAQMAQELGLQALHIPESYGGMGFSFIEVGLVLEEMGRALLCSPYFSSVVLAANAVLNAGTDEQRQELLPGIASGQTRAALAVAEHGDVWDPNSIETQAAVERDGYRLYGTKTVVIDGHTANTLVVAAREPGSFGEDRVGLYVVDPGDEFVTRTPLPTFDQTRKLGRITLDGAAGRRLGARDSAWPALQRTLHQAAVCLSAEQLGGAQRCLDMAVEHAKVREQFGRPIGAFQSIKHRCADMLLAVEAARSAVHYALAVTANTTDIGPTDELGLAASLAHSHCSEVFSQVASDNVQVHGGVGFTWEHDAHLYVKRAKSSEAMLGGVTRHRELLATRIGL